MKEIVNLGIVGVSKRGRGLINNLMLMDDIKIIAVCDLYSDRAEDTAQHIEKNVGYRPQTFTDYRKMLEIKEIDAVITPSSWNSHVQICLDSMEAGKYVATEVGGADDIQQCYDLVRVSERTGMPCMMLENCCYGRNEMAVLNMVRKGMFGTVVHAEGGYHHDLRDEITTGEEQRHYRLRNFLNRNGELYPTHQLGPICKWLEINRGNRMISLVSMASKSCGLEEYVKEKFPADHKLQGVDFAEGDVVTTLIKCAHGETITLTHDNSLPRPYSRGNLLSGTKGIFSEDRGNCVHIEGVTTDTSWVGNWDPISDYYGKYDHPLWRRYVTEGVKAGHDGMDFLVLSAFVDAVKRGVQPPIDVYDTAALMAITPLSESSIACGSMPVSIPDFTHGMWLNREAPVESDYRLDGDFN